jgi:hypothetical protein
MNEFKTTCPRCNAAPEDACLLVIGFIASCSIPLGEDGFSTEDASFFDTNEETVRCSACEETFPLGECIYE